MWYGELEARHALSHGLIQWSDVKAIYRASGRIPRESVETVLGLMEAAWPRDQWKSRPFGQGLVEHGRGTDERGIFEAMEGHYDEINASFPGHVSGTALIRRRRRVSRHL